jgi:hypothetical protein
MAAFALSRLGLTGVCFGRFDYTLQSTFFVLPLEIKFSQEQEVASAFFTRENTAVFSSFRLLSQFQCKSASTNFVLAARDPKEQRDRERERERKSAIRVNMQLCYVDLVRK